MLALCMDRFSVEVRRTVLEGEMDWNGWNHFNMYQQSWYS